MEPESHGFRYGAPVKKPYGGISHAQTNRRYRRSRLSLVNRSGLVDRLGPGQGRGRARGQRRHDVQGHDEQEADEEIQKDGQESRR